jgi:hypothetical protein
LSVPFVPEGGEHNWQPYLALEFCAGGSLVALSSA